MVSKWEIYFCSLDPTIFPNRLTKGKSGVFQTKGVEALLGALLVTLQSCNAVQHRFR